MKDNDVVTQVTFKGQFNFSKILHKMTTLHTK